ncbi:MAG TPA: AIM24 family protein [Dehalococcoidia bacterium]|nr:AIM24 family protein [Dehalococcoidia bacterium]
MEGELVPVLHVQVDGSVPLYFEHHVVLWKTPGLQIGIKGLKGAFKRVVAGMPIFLTQTESPGEIAFSRDGVGHVFPIHLEHGQSIEVREHQFLAATGNVEYTFTRQKGIANVLFGSTGFFVDRFTATNHEGVVWLQGYGNVFETVLGPGEQIDVEPGGWIYREESVGMDQQLYGLKTGIFGGSGRLVFNRFTGPGRVGIQSMYVHLPTSEEEGKGNSGGPAWAKVVGSILNNNS